MNELISPPVARISRRCKVPSASGDQREHAARAEIAEHVAPDERGDGRAPIHEPAGNGVAERMRILADRLDQRHARFADVGQFVAGW